jgi:hypothetical protein
MQFAMHPQMIGGATPETAGGKVAPQVMMMPSPMHQQVQAMQFAMHPQMIGGATPETAGGKVAPQVMMMPIPAMPQVAGMMRPMEAARLPETVGPAVVSMPYAMDMNQYACRPAATPTAGSEYARSPQFADSSPSFRDVCSPNYQSSVAYERYVKDIMNAEGDDFQFDWPTNRANTQGHGSGVTMMVEKTRMPESEVSTDEGAWSYASEPSNQSRWFNTVNGQLVLSP